MSDIVERLLETQWINESENGTPLPNPVPYVLEVNIQAADEIESLRQRVKELEEARDKYMEIADYKTAELAELKSNQIADEIGSLRFRNNQLTADVKQFGEEADNWMLKYEEAASELAALKQAQQGWQLVPIDPTDEMYFAGETAFEGGYIFEMYKAMLAAAPKPEEK